MAAQQMTQMLCNDTEKEVGPTEVEVSSTY
jgi:hypothetical protein